MTAHRVIFKNAHWVTMNSASDLGELRDAALIADRETGMIEWIGPQSDLGAVSPDSHSTIDLEHRLVTPGLVDCHTHLVFGGSRVDEWQQRIKGATYEEIARAGGGIRSTVQATRDASLESLVESGTRRADQLLRQGVTTLEIKSGYGLDVETELKMLDAAESIAERSAQDVSLTFLGAHTIPTEFANDADAYLDLVIEQALPRAAEKVEAVDVFCENIAFDLAQTEKVFQAATAAGLAVKVHAEQLSLMGGAQLAARYGAWSADHLEYIDDEGVQAMAAAGTVAVLLPGAFYFINETQKPPIDLFRKHGVPIAIATDLNPGSSPVYSQLLMANFACTLFGMTPEESLKAITIESARAIRRDDRIGSLAVGKLADIVVWDVDSAAELCYGIGHQPCLRVYKRGQLAYARSPEGTLRL